MTSLQPRFPLWAALVGSGLAGALVAVQTRINGGLSQELGNGYVAAAVSFGSGLLILVLVLLVNERGRVGLARVRTEVRGGHLPMWALTGGAFGALFVLAQGLIATVIGLALFAVGAVAGLVFGGLVLDRVGVGPAGKLRTSIARVIGTALATIAVVLSVVAELLAPQGYETVIWLVLIPVLIGGGMAFQSAINGLVRAAAQSAVTATFVNFVVGTVVLIVAAAVSVAVQGWPTNWPSEPWLYFGGTIGALFIAVAAMLVRTAGVLLLSMSNVAGQLVGSVVIEAVSPLAAGLTPWLVLGAGVALVAVIVAALPLGRRSKGGVVGAR